MELWPKYNIHIFAIYWVYLWSLNKISPVVAEIWHGWESATEG